VAVRAADLAERDLGLDAGPRRPAGDESADQLSLLVEMIEVQDPHVALVAVDAWMLLEVRGHLLTCGGRPPAPRGIRLLKMFRATAPEVLTEALATPVLQPLAGALW